MEKKTLFLTIGVFWLVIILGFIAIKEFTLQTGKEVLLKTVPIDPRDLFRGDYVILRYDISNLDLNAIPTDYKDFKSKDKIYVSLNIQDGYGIPSKLHKEPPEEGLFIKGIVKDAGNNMVAVEYGIENYFVPEGKGRNIEQARGRALDSKVLIDRFGSAGIKNLLIDGKEVDFSS